MTDIIDGTSNTFLIGETKYGQLWQSGTTTWHISFASNYYFGSGQFATSGAVARDVPNSVECEPAEGGCYNTSTSTFGSNHDNGAWFAMADGSVQFITRDIAQANYWSLAVRHDGAGALP
jgi:hypothetical protein